jgi:hypothetical protein
MVDAEGQARLLLDSHLICGISAYVDRLASCPQPFGGKPRWRAHCAAETSGVTSTASDYPRPTNGSDTTLRRVWSFAIGSAVAIALDLGRQHAAPFTSTA